MEKATRPDRVQMAISVMQRAQEHEHPLDMQFWQNPTYPNLCHSEEELYDCGTPACFAGTLAVSPEWREGGGKIGTWGMPVFDGWLAERAIQEWLGISFKQAANLCATSLESGVPPGFSSFYGKQIEDITHQDVIGKLQALL